MSAGPGRTTGGRRGAGGAGVLRVAGTVRLAWGVLLILRTRPALAGLLRQRPDDVTTRAARALGVREVLQGAAVVLAPSGLLSRSAPLVDGAHAASMAALAAVAPHRRRACLVSGAMATGAAVLDVALRRRTT